MKTFKVGVYLTPTGQLATLENKTLYLNYKFVNLKLFKCGDFKSYVFNSGDFEGKQFINSLLESSVFLGRL